MIQGSRIYTFVIVLLVSLISCVFAWQPFEPPADSTLHIKSGSAFASMNVESQWVLQWIPEEDIIPGTVIELRSLGLRTFFMWTYTKIEIDKADIIMRRPIEMTGHYLFSHAREGYVIARAKIHNGLKRGEPLTIQIAVIPPYHSDVDEAITIWSDDDPNDDKEEYKARSRATAVLHVGPGPVERLVVNSHPMPGVNGKVRTVIAPEDRYGNLASFSRPVTATLTWNNQTWTLEIQKSKILHLDAPVSEISRLQVSVPLDEMHINDNITNVRIDGGKVIVTGSPVWTKSPHGMTAGFGEFHWHTEVSGDGGGKMENGYKVARDHLNMNYLAPGDHTPVGPRWEHLVKVTEQFNDPGEFATFFGWENSTKQGHDNYYFTDPMHRVHPHQEYKLWGFKPFEIQDQLEELYNQLPDNNKFIAIPHHTNAVAETRKPDGTPYWYPYPFYKPDSFHRLFEIFQIRGNMERNEYTDAWRGWYAWGASAQDALRAGYKVGFVGCTDNHNSKPGFAYGAKESYGRVPTYSRIMTGLWTPSVTREDVFLSLHNRASWAVWDTRAIVYFAVNNAIQGSEISVRQGQNLTARIKVSAECPFQSLEIVSDAKVAWSTSTAGRDCDIQANLGKADSDGYYYLRGLLRNGGILYASPVFVTAD